MSLDTSAIKGPSPEGLYRVEHFTDPGTGIVLEVYTPVKLLSLVENPANDTARKPRFFSTLHLNVGPTRIPWRFEIEAEALGEAVEKYAASAATAAMKAAEEIESQQRKAILLGAGGRVQ